MAAEERDKKILEALKNGPKEFGELVRRTDLTAQSLDRGLKQLAKRGNIIREEITPRKKLYALPEHKDKLQERAQPYLTGRLKSAGDGKAYETTLQHSEKLFREATTWKFPDGSCGYKLDEYLLQHLETGYPDIYKMWERMEGTVRSNAEYKQLKSQLAGEIIKLKSCVDRGKPLRGKCDACPSVKVDY